MSGQKHTNNRNLIIKLCYVSYFDINETNRALILYGMFPLYARIKNGYKSFDTLDFFDGTLEENGTDKTENIKFKFSCIDADSYKIIFESDYVEISAD